MKTIFSGIALTALLAAAPAFATDNPVQLLAKETGLSERRVQMVLGTRSSFAEYVYTYDRTAKKLRTAIGAARYDQLMSNGEFIAASPETKARALLVALETRRAEPSL